MEKAVVAFNSGQLNRYFHDVAPFERKLKRNNKVNWAIGLAILLLSAVAGVFVGFFILPTFVDMFAGLIGGSVVGALLLVGYYFLRSSVLSKAKTRVAQGLSSCKSTYLQTYKIPEGAITCNIVASNFLPKEYFGPSLIYARDDGSISVVGTDYEHERNEIRYSEKSVIAYSLFSDSRVLVQSEEGYAVISSEAKTIFISSDLPLLSVDSNQLFELSGTGVRSFTRPKDLVQKRETPSNPTWDPAIRALSSYRGKGEA